MLQFDQESMWSVILYPPCRGHARTHGSFAEKTFAKRSMMLEYVQKFCLKNQFGGKLTGHFIKNGLAAILPPPSKMKCTGSHFVAVLTLTLGVNGP